MVLLGIDLGKSGGLAWFDGTTIKSAKMPESLAELDKLVKSIAKNNEVLALMEIAGRHQRGNSASRSATFARHCGNVEMACITNNIKLYEVAPQVWENLLPCELPAYVKGESTKEKSARKTLRKNIIKETMINAYGTKITLKTSDAYGLLWCLQNKQEETMKKAHVIK